MIKCASRTPLPSEKSGKVGNVCRYIRLGVNTWWARGGPGMK